MQITLSYTVCACTPWNPFYDFVGEYTLKSRKTPEEVEAEKEFLKSQGIDRKVSNQKFERKSVFEIKGDTCFFLIGFWARLKEELEKHNEQFTIIDKRDPSLKPIPDYSKLQGTQFRQGQLEAIATIATSDCGLICSSVGWGKSFVIKQLCKIYPKTNILIVCPAGEVVKELYRDINNELPGEVGLLNMDSNNIDGKRIIVTTCKSMGKLNPERVQLMLVDEAHGTGDGAYGQQVMQFSFCRRFGFTATPIRNSGDYKFFEALYGPILQQVTYQESQDAGSVTPIKYSMVSLGHRLPYLENLVEVVDDLGRIVYRERNAVLETDTLTGKTKPRDLPDTVRNKLFYWNNRMRNRAVVQVFNQVKAANPNIQILIMTQSLAHLIRIAEMLPELKWMHGERGNLDKYSKQKDLREVNLKKYELDTKKAKWVKHCLETGEIQYGISTGCLSAGVNLKHLAVLIRVDGAASGIPSVQIPGRLARLDEGKDCAYLIDFADDFCEPAVNRAKSRQKEYDKQGWREISFVDCLNELRKENEK